MEHYDFPLEEAKLFTSFLESMLVYKPEYRPTAAECLQHPWITGDQEDFLEGRFFEHQYHQLPPTDTEALGRRHSAAALNASEEEEAEEQEHIRNANGSPIKRAIYKDISWDDENSFTLSSDSEMTSSSANSSPPSSPSSAQSDD